MMWLSLVIVVALGFLVVSSLEDLKTGEIPEHYSFGLGVVVLVVACGAAWTYRDVMVVLEPLALGILYFGVGYVLYFFGQWGGGDVKLTASLGVVFGYLNALGYPWPAVTFFPYQATYFINLAVLATPYVIIYTLLMGLEQPRLFAKFGNTVRSQPRLMLLIGASFVPLLTAMYTEAYVLAQIYLFIPLLVVASIYMKVVEAQAMQKRIPVADLREGDIVAEDVVAGDEVLARKREIEGVTQEQVEKIQELAARGALADQVTVKWGVKFAPVLLFSFVATYWTGNLVEVLVTRLAV